MASTDSKAFNAPITIMTRSPVGITTVASLLLTVQCALIADSAPNWAGLNPIPLISSAITSIVPLSQLLITSEVDIYLPCFFTPENIFPFIFISVLFNPSTPSSLNPPIS